MASFRQGDVIKVPFPYTDRPARQSPPALVVSIGGIEDAHGLLWVAMITRAENRGWPGDVPVNKLDSAGLPVPSVIRLLAYRHIPQQSRALSRKNILLRDRNTCQFCGRIFPSSELTLDHVVPRSRGGRSSWENLVACCYRCNNSKGDRTPEEAGLKLARRPRPFTLHTSRQLMRLIGHRDERWRKYLFY